MDAPAVAVSEAVSAPAARPGAWRVGWLTPWRCRLIFGILVILVGCSTTAPKPRAHSTAEVTIGAITPPGSSQLLETSVLDATLAYRIDGFVPEPDRYYLTIQFEKKGGGSFNHYHRFNDEPVLTTAEGAVHVRYEVANVWNDQRLKKPIRLSFYVVERTGPHDSLVIGQAGPIDYAVK